MHSTYWLRLQKKYEINLIILLYPIKIITNLVPEDSRERVIVYFHYSADFEGTVLFNVQTIRLDVHCSILARIRNVVNAASYYGTLARTILYLYCLLQHHSPMYYLLDSHCLRLH